MTCFIWHYIWINFPLFGAKLWVLIASGQCLSPRGQVLKIWGCIIEIVSFKLKCKDFSKYFFACLVQNDTLLVLGVDYILATMSLITGKNILWLGWNKTLPLSCFYRLIIKQYAACSFYAYVVITTMLIKGRTLLRFETECYFHGLAFSASNLTICCMFVLDVWVYLI